MDLTLAIILIALGVVVGIALGFAFGIGYRKKVAEREIGSAEQEASFIFNMTTKEALGDLAETEEDLMSWICFPKQAEDYLKFRKENPIAVYGAYKEYNKSSKELYVYERTYEGKRLLVICSYSDKAAEFKAPEGYDLSKGKVMLCSYKDNPVKNNGFTTRPYETRVYLLK